MSYQPSEQLLKKYADVLVKFALRNGKGINTGDVVFGSVPECAKPMLFALQESILGSGGHPMLRMIPDGLDKHFYMHASDEQIAFLSQPYVDGKIAAMTHSIAIIAEYDKHVYRDVPTNKLTRRKQAAKYYKEKMFAKVEAKQADWTLALYGTEAMAAEVGMSSQEYWQQIIQACFLDADDPIAQWKKIFTQLETIRSTLTDMCIVSVHIEGDDADLHVTLGADRKWLAGSGNNIPSFETFISPDRRGTNGWIRFNQPLYRYGQMIRGIRLEFTDGVITHASADENEQLLLEMIQIPNADKIGEFSLTDRRCSRITKFMAETLYDENVGGPYGNTHVAIGSAYKDSYRGDPTSLSTQDWMDRGFNESAEHCDIVSTTNRQVTATLADGSTKIIYKDGAFQFPID